MFSGGFTEIGFILFIAFLLFGPKKLPEIARVLGKGMGELRRASNELKFSLEEEIRNLDRKDDDTYSSETHEVSSPEEETYPYLESKEENYEEPENYYESSETYEGSEHYEASESYDSGEHDESSETYESGEDYGRSESDEFPDTYKTPETHAVPEEETHEVEAQPESSSETTPEHVYDYSKAPHDEPESQP